MLTSPIAPRNLSRDNMLNNLTIPPSLNFFFFGNEATQSGTLEALQLAMASMSSLINRVSL